MTRILIPLTFLFALFAGGWFLSAASDTSSRPPEPEELLGATQESLVRHFGVPRSIESGGSCLVWSYTSDMAKVGVAEFVVHDGTIIRVEVHPKAFAARVAPPAQGPYLGQPVSELVRRLGSAQQISHGQIVSELHYPGQGRITIKNGLVVGVAEEG